MPTNSTTIPLAMKPCTQCGETKPLTDYYTDKRRSDGRRGACKSCHNARVHLARDADPERKRQQDKRWRETHPEQVAIQRQRAKARPKGKLARVQRWRERHRTESRAHDKVKKAVAKGTLPKPDACSRCGSRGIIEGHHPDYSQPLAVVWLCRHCHIQEHANG